MRRTIADALAVAAFVELVASVYYSTRPKPDWAELAIGALLALIAMAVKP